MEQNKPFYSLALWVEKDPGEICGLTQEKPSTSGRSRAARPTVLGSLGLTLFTVFHTQITESQNVL